MSNEIAIAVGLSDIEKMAKYAVDSGLFGVKTLPQAVALMLLCQAKGMHPMEAMEEFHIIQGRHTMKSERMLAKFQAAGGTVSWKELTDTRAEATFSHKQGGAVTIDWDIERAKRAGVYGKDNWKNYPRAMLRSRVVSEGVTAVLPGVKAGAITPEEAIDLPPTAELVERDVTPAKPLTGVAALEARVGELMPTSGDPIGKVIAPNHAEPFDLTPPTVEEQVLSQLRDRALEGQASLKDAWDGIGKDLRKSLGDHLPGLKEAAAKAEASESALRG